MKKLKTNLLFFFLTCLGVGNLLAQNGIVAVGGNIIGTTGSVSYSVGQVDYLIKTDSGGTISAGLQQPYEIFILSGIEEKDIDLVFVSAIVYPNPTNDILTLKVENYDLRNLSYQLYDLYGKLLLDKKVVSGESTIYMAELANATYFIKILDGNNLIKMFKIIKTL